eukprot:1157836-Pelagomonas_calceolata.AAC.8
MLDIKTIKTSSHLYPACPLFPCFLAPQVNSRNRQCKSPADATRSMHLAHSLLYPEAHSKPKLQTALHVPDQERMISTGTLPCNGTGGAEVWFETQSKTNYLRRGGGTALQGWPSAAAREFKHSIKTSSHTHTHTHLQACGNRSSSVLCSRVGGRGPRHVSPECEGVRGKQSDGASRAGAGHKVRGNGQGVRSSNL